MIFGNKRRIISLVLAGCLLFTAEFEVFAANPESEAQAIETINYEISESPLSETWKELDALASMAVDTQMWQGKAIVNTESEVDVYAEPDGAAIGKMYKNTVVTVLSKGEQWTKISSGSVEGYARSEVLLYGSAAVERAKVTCVAGTRDAKTNAEIEAELKSSAVRLLAALIYCEAGNQPYEGKVAVGSVVMNRIASGRFPNTLEGVIYQRGQFTPARSGKLARVLSSGRIPSTCFDAARDAMDGAKPLGNVMFFNTGYGNIKLGDHYFT